MGNQPGKVRKNYPRKIDWTSAERPSPPGKPYLVPETNEKYSDVITIRWSPPLYDGGAPIIGYIVEHRRTGSPHWLRATPHLVHYTELPLTGLEPGWRYQFRITAENEVGKSDPGELSEPLTVTPQKWAASAPFFNIELQDKIGLENEKVEFKVQVIGVPAPSISWYKDGFEVFSSRRTKIVSEDDHSTFIIHQAALEDEGEIKCTATNRAGYAVTKALLKLQAPPRIRLPRQYEDGLIFKKGDPIRLKVTTAGRPKPQVYWYHNGEVLKKTNRIDIVDSDTNSMLKINDACRDDRGEYVIVGVNKIGDDTASFLVTVTDQPMPPENLQVTLTERTAKLTWSSPDDDGGCKIGTYIIEYFRIGWDMWLKAKNSRQLYATLENLIEGSQYKFRVRAENPYGISDPSEESKLIFIPDPKRGILYPPPVTETSKILEKMEIDKNFETNEENTENVKRKLLEEKARKLLDTPLSELLPLATNEKSKHKSLPESIPVFAEEENIPPFVPRRKNKGKKRLNLNQSDSEIEVEKKPKFESNSTSESLLNENFNRDVSINEPSDNVNNKMKESIESPKTWYNFDGKVPHNLESPLYLRENDSIMHGSSELMLVLYPRDRSKSVELNAQQRSEIEMSLRGEGVAPPMSLSAPELSCTEYFEIPQLRDAVSSTELLHEKTAERLYQYSLDDQVPVVVKRPYNADRKSAEKRSSLKDALLERRHSLREAQAKQGDLNELSKLENKTEKTNEKIQKNSSATLGQRPDVDRLTSVERERIEFANVREKLQKKKEEKQQKAFLMNNHYLNDSVTTSPTSSSYDFEEEDDDLESDETLEKGRRFQISNFSSRKDSKKSVSDTVIFSKLNQTAYFTEDQEKYNSSNAMSFKDVSVKEIKENKVKTQKDMKSKSLPVFTEKDKIENSLRANEQKKKKKASKIFKKISLKRNKKIPEVTVTLADPNQPPPPKPILKNKTLSNTNNSSATNLSVRSRKISDKSISEDESENEFPGKKKKVRIAEPNGKEEANQKPVDENAVENQVLIFHYSDILKEYGSHKRPLPKLYLSHDELKAHASKLDQKVVKNTQKDKDTALESPQKSEGIKENITKSTESTLYALQSSQSSQSDNDSFQTPSISSESTEPKFSNHFSLFEYATDVAMFMLACWLYFFKNELYAIPILGIMAYRQLKDIVFRKYERLKGFFSKNISEK